MKEYIGKRKVVKADIKDGIANVTFKNGDKVEYTEKLYNLIKTNDLQEGTDLDIMCAKIALKWFLELVDYEFPAGSVNTLTSHLINVVNNKASEAIGKKFGYESKEEITIKDLL